jgi:hypothetical protein
MVERLLVKLAESWRQFGLGKTRLHVDFYRKCHQLKDGKLSSGFLMSELWRETFGKRIRGSQDLVDLHARQVHKRTG